MLKLNDENIVINLRSTQKKHDRWTLKKLYYYTGLPEMMTWIKESQKAPLHNVQYKLS